MKVSQPPLLPTLCPSFYILVSHWCLLTVGSFARGLSVSHTVTSGMELDYYGKMEIRTFIPFLLSSAMEIQLYSISI